MVSLHSPHLSLFSSMFDFKCLLSIVLGVQIPITYEAYPQNNGYCNHDYANTMKIPNEIPQQPNQNIYYTTQNNCGINQLDSKLNHLKIKDNIDIFDRLS